MTPISERILRARLFAREGHDSIGQKRKYSGVPYWTHTEAVAQIVSEYGGTEDMIIAALNHDLAEDVFPVNPKYSLDLIRAEFGNAVADMVFDLTNQYTKENYPLWNRAVRHKKEMERLGLIPEATATIKLSDIFHNTSSIVAECPKFAKTYLREKESEINYLCRGDAALWIATKEQIQEGLRSL